MTLMEKLEALTPEQQQKFDAVTTEQELDAFLEETGAGLTDEEKAAAWKYIQARQAKPDGDLAGKTELADEELDNVAGGHGGMCHKGGREVVTLVTGCVHGLKHYVDIEYYTDVGRLKRIRGDRIICCGYVENGEYKSATSNNCKYLLYEKGLWLCDYPEHLKK